MDHKASRRMRPSVWEVAAVLELAAAEVRPDDAPAPSWDEALARVRAAQARAFCTRQRVRIIRQGITRNKGIAIPFA